MLVRAISAAETAGRAVPLEWRLSLGSVLQQCGEPYQALQTFNLAVATHPESSDAHFAWPPPFNRWIVRKKRKKEEEKNTRWPLRRA